MTTVATAPLPLLRYWDHGGRPLASGRLWTYVAGTSDLLAVFKDYACTVPWENPIILSDASWPGGAGYVPGVIYELPDRVVKYVLEDAHGVEQWSADNTPPNVGTNAGPNAAASLWVPFTPTWTNTSGTNTLGNGLLSGRWRYWGATTIQFVINFTWGSTTTSGPGDWRFGGLPVAVNPDLLPPRNVVVSAFLAAIGATQGLALFASPVPTTTLSLWRPGVQGVYDPAPFSATIPAPWQNFDNFHAFGEYEVVPL